MSKKLIWLFAGILTAATFAGCGDDPPAQEPGGGDADAGVEDTLPADDTGSQDEQPPVGGPYLVLITEAETTASFSTEVPIRVAYRDGDDNPIADAFISFEPWNTIANEPLMNTADSRLSRSQSATDADGEAQTLIQAGIEEVDFDVKISVFGDDAVQPIYVQVHVQPKDSADYLIRVQYCADGVDGDGVCLEQGQLQLYNVDVLLFQNERACHTLNQSPTEPPSEDSGLGLTMLPDADGNIVDRPLNVPTGTVFRYAVARGVPVDDTGDDGVDYFAAWGCVDSLPDPEVGTQTEVLITMHNLWPELEGTYDITTEMDLLGAIPDSAENIVRVIRDVFDNPGFGVLKLAAMIIDESDDDEIPFWEESGWELLFVECAGVGEEVGGASNDECLYEGYIAPSTPWGVAASNLLSDLLESAVRLIPGGVGDFIITALERGNEIFDTVENFTLGGTLFIEGNPDESGLLPSNTRIAYNRVSFFWEGATQTVPMGSESVIRAGSNPCPDPSSELCISSAVRFHPDMDEATYALDVSPYTINLQYGEVLIFVLENIVFPQLMGPDVDSFVAFFDQLVDCEALSDGLTEPAASAAESLCDSLKNTLVDLVENWLRSLSVDVVSYYRMGTPADDPCPITLSSSSRDFSATGLGGSDRLERCVWEGTIRYSEDDPVGDDMSGNWFADIID